VTEEDGEAHVTEGPLIDAGTLAPPAGIEGDVSPVAEGSFPGAATLAPSGAAPLASAAAPVNSSLSSDQTRISIQANSVILAPGVSRVQFAVWGSADGQNDLVWHQAQLKETGTDGRQVWYVKTSLPEHLFEEGQYLAHVYVTDVNGAVYFIGSVTKALAYTGDPKVSVSLTPSGGFTVTASGKGLSDAKSMQFPTWSESGGQDDIIWYQAKKEGNAFVARGSLASHRSFGKFYVHAYADHGSGARFVGATTFDVEYTAPSGGATQFVAVNSDTNTGYFAVHVPVTAGSVPISKVSIAIWGEKDGQNDLRWVDAHVVGGNVWGAADAVPNHRFETGTYIAHVYVTDVYGNSTFISGSSQSGIRYTGPYQLSVPLINQLPSYPVYCEAASIAMLVSHAAGYTVPMNQVVGFMPRSSRSPDLGWGQFGGSTGWTIYPPATNPMLNPYGLSTRDLSGSSLETIKEVIRSGNPVVVWFLGALGPGSTHCVIVTGYDGVGNIYYNDPYGAVSRVIPADTFNRWYTGHGSKAMTYSV
jgi:uncharacterized protein YvpB